jgi:hypothetical protein
MAKVVRDKDYFVSSDFDEMLEDRGNGTFVAVRKVKWGNKGDYKVDIRKWRINSSGEESPDKGVVLSDKAADNLVYKLVKHGYGDTKIINGLLNQRDNTVAEPEQVLYDPVKELA